MKQLLNTVYFIILLLALSCNVDRKNSHIKNHSQDTGIAETKIDTLSILSKAVSSIKDYHVSEWKKGDIDNDKHDDFVLIMSSDSIYSEPFENTYLTKIVLLKSIDFSNYKILSSNDNLVECSTCANGSGRAPLQNISIEDGLLSFGITYGMCPDTYTIYSYKFINGGFYLESIEREDNYSICRKPDKNGDDPITYYKTKTRKDFGWVKFNETVEIKTDFKVEITFSE